jgi:molecular chaperone GrpE
MAEQPKKVPINERDVVDVTDGGEGNEVESQIATLTEERDANYDRFLRAQAELQTARTRWQRDLEEQRKFQDLSMIRDLLSPLDNLRRAVEAAKSGTSVEQLKTGVDMVLKQFDEVFAKHHAKPIPALGEHFDPNHHEAISQMPSADKPPMTVLVEAERGYMLHDRVVRPSKVIVSVAPPTA